MHGDKLRNARLMQNGPNTIELRSIGQGLLHFNGRIWQGVWPFREQFTVFQKAHDRLPLHYTSLFQPFRCMESNDIFFLRDELPNQVEQSAH